MELAMGLTLTLSYALWNCAHPLILCLILIIYATLISLVCSIFISKWMAYAIILIFLGGMMVIFIYVTTLSGNEKFFISFNPINMAWLILIMAYSSLLISSTPMMFVSSTVSHIYSNLSPILWFSVIYLLFILFTVIKLSESFKGALVKYS